jgi:ribosomal protein S18 acetylase RimI-like enzyme
MTIVITALRAAHDLDHFDCGQPMLNNWLQQTARQHQKKLLSQTYVLLDETLPSKVLGFYCINQRGLIPSDIWPLKEAQKLPIKFPALTIGRLAVDVHAQGYGYGEELLVDAMLRAKKVSQVIGSWGLFVDAKDDQAAAFYSKYGFVALASNPLALFIPIASLPEDVD